MSKTLVILEVSRKQDYIFASKKLKENADRSNEIAYVTGAGFFKAAAADFCREENLVFSGGGHTVLCFDEQKTATEFAKNVSEAALRQYPGMELFVKQIAYDKDKAPGENLKALTEALERKKALRQNAFTRMSFGVEQLDKTNWQPVPVGGGDDGRSCADAIAEPPGWEYPTKFDDLSGKDNFIAVVHIDGNAMGARVDKLYGKYTDAADWDAFCKDVRAFSEGIQADFERAFTQMVAEVVSQSEALKKIGVRQPTLPVRPIILAGDDVCFVSAGCIGLECARVFLEKLSAMCNKLDGLPYAACAGVALVHRKYPFHQAYNLAEQLCSNAKKFGAEIDASGAVSAMDWHIEFGQLKDSLGELRKDYETDDGNRLELRPVTVVVPEGVNAEKKVGGVRTYDFFRGMCLAIHGEAGKTARGKIKDLREAFRQGLVESRFFLQDKEIGDLLYHAFSAEHGDGAVRAAVEQLKSGKGLGKEAFREIPEDESEGVRRCLYFDAIELIDHCEFFEEVKA